MKSYGKFSDHLTGIIEVDEPGSFFSPSGLRITTPFWGLLPNWPTCDSTRIDTWRTCLSFPWLCLCAHRLPKDQSESPFSTWRACSPAKWASTCLLVWWAWKEVHCCPHVELHVSHSVCLRVSHTLVSGCHFLLAPNFYSSTTGVLEGSSPGPILFLACYLCPALDSHIFSLQLRFPPWAACLVASPMCHRFLSPSNATPELLVLQTLLPTSAAPLWRTLSSSQLGTCSLIISILRHSD